MYNIQKKNKRSLRIAATGTAHNCKICLSLSDPLQWHNPEFHQVTTFEIAFLQRHNCNSRELGLRSSAKITSPDQHVHLYSFLASLLCDVPVVLCMFHGFQGGAVFHTVGGVMFFKPTKGWSVRQRDFAEGRRTHSVSTLLLLVVRHPTRESHFSGLSHQVGRHMYVPWFPGVGVVGSHLHSPGGGGSL